MKIAWYWHKSGKENQWYRNEDPNINPHTYEHKIFGKEVKNITREKESIFNKWFWHDWISTCRRMRRGEES